MDGVRLVQIILLLILLGVGVYLLRLFNALKIEKRLAKFTINSVKNEDISLMDRLVSYFWVLAKFISKILRKSVIWSRYAQRYNKYISVKKRETRDAIDYVSAKFLLAFLVLLLSLLTLAFNKMNFDFMILLSIFVVAFFVPDFYLKWVFMNKRKRIEEDLLKAIIIMNNAFQSGRNIMQAIECVKLELDGPIQDEFEKMYLDITYGLSLEVVFSRFYERVRLEDAKYITSSLTLLNKTGGDIIKVFSLIQKSIFDKKNLKNELNSLTAASKFVFKMLVVLPFAFVGVIFVLNPSYFKPFIATPLGIIALIFIILLYVLYILVIKKVLEVEL